MWGVWNKRQIMRTDTKRNITNLRFFLCCVDWSWVYVNLRKVFNFITKVRACRWKKDQRWEKHIKNLTWKRERNEWVSVDSPWKGKKKLWISWAHCCVGLSQWLLYTVLWIMWNVKWDKLRKRVILQIFLWWPQFGKEVHTCCSFILAGFGNFLIFFTSILLFLFLSKETIFHNSTNLTSLSLETIF